MSQLGRRRFDDISMNIETMIAEEDDPKQRAFLIVLNNINNSLLANTITVRDIGGKLDSHLVSYENNVRNSDKLLNRGKGVWMVVVWLIGLAQVAALAVGSWGVKELADIHSTQQNAQISITRVESRVQAVEKKVFGP